MMGPVWLLLALPGLLGHVVDLPGCPFEKQTAFCLGSTSCHDLAHAGLTCESIAQIQEGSSQCHMLQANPLGHFGTLGIVS